MKPLKALIIEDSKDDAALLLRYLASSGYDVQSKIVQTAADMKAALAECEWDIILSDYMMPSFTGLDALAVLKESGLDIPIIIISGTIGEDVAVEAMLLGVNDYLIKDNLTRLAPAIERELQSVAIRQAQKQAEESLRRSEASLANAQRIAHIGNWDWDVQNNKLYWSDEIYKIFGSDKNHSEHTYEDFINGVHPEDRQKVQSAVDAALSQTASYNIVHRVARPNGEERIVCEIGEVTFDESGKPLHLLGTVQDITERKLAEEALEKAVRRERTMIENVLDVICTIDIEGKFVSISPACFKVWGYYPEELVGYPYIEFVAPEDVAKTNEVAQKVISGIEATDFENCYLHKNGSMVHVSWTALWSDTDQLMFCVAHDVTERKRAEEVLRENEAKFRDLFDNAPVAYHELDTEGRFTRVNHTEELMLGYTEEELKGRHPWEIIVEKTSREATVAKLAGNMPLHPVERTFIRKDGSKVPVLNEDRLIHGADGKVIGIRSTLQDITERKRIEQQQSAILNALPAHICLLNQAGDILEVNKEWKRFAFENGYVGINAGIGRNYIEICNAATGEFAEGAKQAAEICRAVLAGESSPSEMEYPCHSPTEERWFKLSVTPLHREKSAGAVVMHINITERKRIENQLLHDAFHDGLTELANRTFFIEHLQKTIDRTKRDRSEMFAVLFLDFDRFKVVNDSLGHAEGDNLLRQIARRLESSLRAGDLVARLGGDEFTILVNKLDDTSVALRVAERLQKSLQIPFPIGSSEIYISASIGIALSTSEHERAEDMLRDADIAMYRAKAKGKAQHQVFDQAMHEHASKQLQLETEMRQGLERGEFLLHYQPIMNLETGSLLGFEALVRWKHRTRGMIPPLEFIGAAEENNLILPLGKWILQESCRQLRLWQNNPLASGLTVSVNLSSKQFLQSDLAEQIAATLAETKLNPRCLKLEITESHIMENTEMAAKTMSSLRALGVELSLDDFGTGYSSLSYLHRLPVSYLKIDRSFVNRMIESEENSEIVNTIIKLAQNLKIKVVAEGIETDEHLAQLKLLHCEYGQGYLFAKPLEAEVAKIFIDKNLGNTL